MTSMFKSKLFSLRQFDNKSEILLEEDFRLLINIEKSNDIKVINCVKTLILAKSEKEEIKIMEEMVKDGVVPNLSTAVSAHRIIKFFFEAFCDDSFKDDEINDIVNDFGIIGLNKKYFSLAYQILSNIKEEVDWYDEFDSTKMFEAGLFPKLIKIGTTVELRGVFNREIEGEEKSEQYAKAVSLKKKHPIIPIISIAITLDSGQPDRFVFQATIEDTDWLIERLKASVVKAKILESKYLQKG